MSDRITANLPFRDARETIHFYQALGFVVDYQDAQWLIMTRGPLELEFFPYPDLSPPDSAFSACVRVAALDALYTQWSSVGLPDVGVPRLQGPPWSIADGLRMFALIDPNGSLLRCLGDDVDAA